VSAICGRRGGAKNRKEVRRLSCVCGHEEEDHSSSGECQVVGCVCACYEEDEPPEDADADPP